MEMELAARLTLALTLAIVGITLHLVARIRDERRVFLLDLGREPEPRDRARVRRTLWVNAVTTSVGIAVALFSPNVALSTIVATVGPLIPLVWMLAEMFALARTVQVNAVPGRFLVPLDEPPKLGSYLSPPLQIANLAVLLVSPALFWVIRQHLPDVIPLHFDASGRPNRWGSPDELSSLFGAMLFDYAMLWAVCYTVSKERWVLSTTEPERYATLQRRRRTLIVRLLEAMMLGLNLSFAMIWLGVAFSSLPERSHFLAPIVVAAVLVMGFSIVAPLARFVLPAVRVQNELRKLGGSDALGTRAAGWKWRGMIYYAPDDPAVFVPKRWGIGQTLNMARPGAWLFLGVIVGLPLVIALVATVHAH
jgi:uncharacterized membrane protein